MARWQRIRQNEAGEWAVTDLQRGYRICSFHHDAHGGPHVHHPIEEGKRARARAVRIETIEDAESIKRAYAAAHRSFSWAPFEECVEAWRSTSKSD